jgi:hypothetical protein
MIADVHDSRFDRAADDREADEWRENLGKERNEID